MGWQTYYRDKSPHNQPVITWHHNDKAGYFKLYLGTRLAKTLKHPASLIVQYDAGKIRLRAAKEGEEGLRLTYSGKNRKLRVILPASTLARLVGAVVGERWPWHSEIEGGIEWIVAEKPPKQEV